MTPDSPEAMEEVLWMRFFPAATRPAAARCSTPRRAIPAFERFYTDHLKKILLVRGGQRYLSKGNYNLTRFAYLRRLFPDARFIVPVRDPRWHIASLMKQHRLFCAEERRDPRILKHMRRAGHLEFGLDRRAINVGDTAAAQAIEALWREGQEVRGWARYWAMLYGFVLDQREADPALERSRDAGALRGPVRPRRSDARGRVRPCRARARSRQRAAMAARLSQPTYYDPGFSAAEEAVIAERDADSCASGSATAEPSLRVYLSQQGINRR